MEIQILEAIAEKEETLDGRNLCLTHVDWFGYNGHICLAFELLGDSVFDFLKDNEYQVKEKRERNSIRRRDGEAAQK